MANISKNDCPGNIFKDDEILIKAYKNSVKFVDIDTDTIQLDGHGIINKETFSMNSDSIQAENNFKVGDFVRATYKDGLDYEAKILSIDNRTGTCILKYIGYNNEQEVRLRNLVTTWGKRVRRMQFATATMNEHLENTNNTHKRNRIAYSKSERDSNMRFPPFPPILNSFENVEFDNISAMLMSWYMSGYYTGMYQGQQMAQANKKN